MEEEGKIIGDATGKVEDAARKLVGACLNAKGGNASDSSLTSVGRAQIALFALAQEIVFIAEQIVLQSTSHGKGLDKGNARKFSDALGVVRDIAPSGLKWSPELVKTFIGYFGSEFKGAPGRPQVPWATFTRWKSQVQVL